MKLEVARRDYYRRRAQKEGYRSRAAYKLIQINSKYHIFRRAQMVIDLGCFPGGWLEVASESVGRGGRVFGIDLRPCEVDVENCETVRGDARDDLILGQALRYLGGKADVVLSDISPNLSGVWELDHMVQASTSSEILDNLHTILKEEGVLVMKVFQGEESENLRRKAKSLFRRLEISKPDASRKESSEVYFVGLGFKPKFV
jgi:23S rRNA (uridine2552-2'-O)-methyltransferase